MATHPGLGECLFSQDAQRHVICRLIDFIEGKGICTAMPLYGTMPEEEHTFNEAGHQTSQNFLRDHSPPSVDTLRFDLLAHDLKTSLKKDDPLFCTWLVLWIMYVSPTVRDDVLKNTPPNLGNRFFEHFDKRMCMYITGSIDYKDRSNTEITTVEAPTAVSKEWHLYEQYASLEV